jgi:hypothetical protein
MGCCRDMHNDRLGRNPVNPVLSCAVRSPPFWDIPCPAPLRALDPFAGLQNRAHERAASATRDYGGKLVASRATNVMGLSLVPVVPLSWGGVVS